MSVTGEQLYDELCAAAEEAHIPLREFVDPIMSTDWKIEQLRISRWPQKRTIERVRALIAGEPIPGGLPRRKGDYDPLLQRTRRVDRARLGIAPSRREIMEAELAARAIARRNLVETTRELVSLAHSTRRPGQTIDDRVRELRIEIRS